MALKRFSLVSSGGTIDKTCKENDNLLCVGPSFAAKFLSSKSGLSSPEAVVESVRKDSLLMSGDDRETLLRDVLGVPSSSVLVTHGTDTMDVTSDFLSAELARIGSDKVVVMTGAMTPASIDMEFAVANVSFACGLLVSGGLSPGVYLAFDGDVFPAGEFEKDKGHRCFRRKRK